MKIGFVFKFGVFFFKSFKSHYLIIFPYLGTNHVCELINNSFKYASIDIYVKRIGDFLYKL